MGDQRNCNLLTQKYLQRTRENEVKKNYLDWRMMVRICSSIIEVMRGD